jgi:molybdenum cofactor biosynthesis enzyme MoaA
MRDSFGREITYLRLSLTDRCDLRCTYCMPERMTFVPRPEILTLDELDRVASCFIRLGVRKVRLTGGEPLVRLREHRDDSALELAIAALVRVKPHSHDFRIAAHSAPAVARTMSVTGG